MKPFEKSKPVKVLPQAPKQLCFCQVKKKEKKNLVVLAVTSCCVQQTNEVLFKLLCVMQETNFTPDVCVLHIRQNTLKNDQAQEET